MKLVSFKICPFVQRLIGVLELKHVDYEVEYISLMDKPDWFLQASPQGKVPILIEDQGVLFESGPICEYVDETCGNFRLHPADPFQKARHRAWIVILHRAHIVEECTGVDFLYAFSKIKKWQQELLCVDELLKSAPEGFIEKFVNFYLHDGTHLGLLMKSGKGRCGSASDAMCDPGTLHACCA